MMNRYPNLDLTVEIAPGSSIEDAARDATNLANNIGIDVVFTFNGVRCMAFFGQDPQRIVDAYHKRK